MRAVGGGGGGGEKACECDEGAGEERDGDERFDERDARCIRQRPGVSARHRAVRECKEEAGRRIHAKRA